MDDLLSPFQTPPVFCQIVDMPVAYAQWVIVETRPFSRGVQPLVRWMLRHNAREAWQSMLKNGQCKPCLERW